MSLKKPSFLRVFFLWGNRKTWLYISSERWNTEPWRTKPLAPYIKSPQSWFHSRRSTIWPHRLFWDYRLPAAHWCTSQDLHSRAAQFRPFLCCSSFCSHSLWHHSHMGTTPAYADVSLETSQPNPRTFCYNLKNHLRIKEEHMWLYGYAMLKTERQSQSGSRRAVIVY